MALSLKSNNIKGIKQCWPCEIKATSFKFKKHKALYIFACALCGLMIIFKLEFGSDY